MLGIWMNEREGGRGLNCRERMAVNLAVEVEGVDVGHARDVVYHSHDALVERRGLQLILRRHLAQKQPP